jgi:hypothetical protein
LKRILIETERSESSSRIGSGWIKQSADVRPIRRGASGVPIFDSRVGKHEQAAASQAVSSSLWQPTPGQDIFADRTAEVIDSPKTGGRPVSAQLWCLAPQLFDNVVVEREVNGTSRDWPEEVLPERFVPSRVASH